MTIQPIPLRNVFALMRLAIAKRPLHRYSAQVTVNPVAGFGDPNIKLAHQRPKTIAGAFFVPAMLRHGGCAWEGFGPAGCQLARFANLRTVASNDRLATVDGGSEPQVGAVPTMKHNPALDPSALRQRAAEHRAMALATLHTDPSPSVRLRCYNARMDKARTLEEANTRNEKRISSAKREE